MLIVILTFEDNNYTVACESAYHVFDPISAKTSLHLQDANNDIAIAQSLFNGSPFALITKIAFESYNSAWNPITVGQFSQINQQYELHTSMGG